MAPLSCVRVIGGPFLSGLGWWLGVGRESQSWIKCCERGAAASRVACPRQDRPRAYCAGSRTSRNRTFVPNDVYRHRIVFINANSMRCFACRARSVCNHSGGAYADSSNRYTMRCANVLREASGSDRLDGRATWPQGSWVNGANGGVACQGG